MVYYTAVLVELQEENGVVNKRKKFVGIVDNFAINQLSSNADGKEGN